LPLKLATLVISELLLGICLGILLCYWDNKNFKMFISYPIYFLSFGFMIHFFIWQHDFITLTHYIKPSLGGIITFSVSLYFISVIVAWVFTSFFLVSNMRLLFSMYSLILLSAILNILTIKRNIWKRCNYMHNGFI